MCADCDGACSAPKFATHNAGPSAMRVVGSAAGPDMIPDALIRQNGQMITYEGLFAGLGPNGEPAAVTMPGTFYGTHATRAGKM